MAEPGAMTLESARRTGSVPASALRMVVGPFELGDNGEGAKSAPIRMKARTAQPVQHWFWGRVVHDMAGMHLHKDRLPVDYVHNPSEVIGYANHFRADTDGLEVSGALVPFKDSDRASEIIHKARAGVPYEASIYFGGDGIKVEDVAEGQAAQVNGFQFAGPGIIIREWPLRGVAVCPYGADMNTRSELAQGESIPVTFTNLVAQATAGKETEMSESKPAEAAPTIPAPAPAALPFLAVEGYDLVGCAYDDGNLPSWAEPDVIHCGLFRVSRRLVDTLPLPWFSWGYSADGADLTACECSEFQRRVKAAGFRITRAGWCGHRDRR
jgi:hypothetical protein